VLNPDAKGMTAGMAFPGFYYIDASGVIREKFFTPKYTDRLTANNVIAKLFPELATEVSKNVDAPYLRLTLSQSDQRVIPGGRVSLIADIELLPDVHVYSPGVKGYRPIQLTLHPLPGVEFQTISYPSSKTLYLEAVKEQVPVYEGHFRISQDVTVNPAKIADALRSVISADKKISISGDLAYQACDKTICYPPTSVPVTWQLQVVTLDLKRSPATIQHKEGSK
jgi:DsbC/DsbD-like thiol-disulfide interchange protein